MKIDDIIKDPRAWEKLEGIMLKKSAQILEFRQLQLAEVGAKVAEEIWQNLQARELDREIQYHVRIVNPNRVEASHPNGNGFIRHELSLLFENRPVTYAMSDVETVTIRCAAELEGLMLTKLKASQFKVFHIIARDCTGGITVKFT